jgi:hypothetical protein
MTEVDPDQDPVAAADAVVAEIDPGLTSPGVEPRDVVLVTGPWLAGTSSVLAALRERMPQRTFVESTELVAGEAPSAVVFVVSAAAPLTESDCALVDLASTYTDLVIGVVSKIDAHRGWREIRDADAAILADRATRYAHMPWVGVAAAPDLGDPQLDELVELLTARLTDPEVRRRNRLRAWEARLDAVIGRYEADGAGADRKARVDLLRQRRGDIARTRRLARTERSIALRSQLQQARVQLGYFARNRCSSVRTELQEDIAGLDRRRMDAFEAYVHRRADDVVEEVDDGVTQHLGDVAAEFGLNSPMPAAPPPEPIVEAPSLRSRSLENRLMVVLGVGFGLGVAFAVSRMLIGASPHLAVVGLVVGAVVGLLLTIWVVNVRGLLRDRAVLDRWVADTTTSLRSTVEELVATRVLAAETAFTTELSAIEDAETQNTAQQVAAIDAELREHVIATAQAAAQRDRRIPPLQRALDTVRSDLYGSAGATGQ